MFFFFIVTFDARDTGSHGGAIGALEAYIVVKTHGGQLLARCGVVFDAQIQTSFK